MVFKIRIVKEVGGDAAVVGWWKLIRLGERGNNF